MIGVVGIEGSLELFFDAATVSENILFCAANIEVCVRVFGCEADVSGFVNFRSAIAIGFQNGV